MKHLAALTLFTFSHLAIHSQNLVTNQVFINTSNQSNTQQVVQHQNKNNPVVVNYNSSARNSFGNYSGNRGGNQVNQNPVNNKVKQVKKQPVNIINTDINDNVNENVNIKANNEVKVQSNPVQIQNVKIEKTVTSPVGMDFKPSGLSGRDYSNGGKLKKGEKNFYCQSTKYKPSKINKRKSGNHKKPYVTHSCAKWKV